MIKEKDHLSKMMGVKYRPEDFDRLRAKAKSEGLDVSQWVRHVSLKGLNNE